MEIFLVENDNPSSESLYMLILKIYIGGGKM